MTRRARKRCVPLLALTVMSNMMFNPTIVWAQAALPAPNPDVVKLAPIIHKILSKQKVVGGIAEYSRLEEGPDAVAFTDEMFRNPETLKEEGRGPRPMMPEGAPADTLRVRTLFDKKSDTVRKKVMIKSGRDGYSFTTTLDNGGVPFQQTIYKEKAGDYQVYSRDSDVFLYLQGKSKGGEILTKEWIHASKPNAPAGSRYVWAFEGGSTGQDIVLKPAENGVVEIYQRMGIQGVDPKDEKKRESVFDVVKKALGGNAAIQGEELVTRISPLVYWTASGIGKTAPYSCPDGKTLVAAIEEPSEAYPLMIDPSFNYGWRFQSTQGQVMINALAMNPISQEVYCGGYASGAYIDELEEFDFVQGVYSGGKEGFVAEIGDGVSPTLVWWQWLGGDNDDEVKALAVIDNEVYAGGSTKNSSWGGESLTFEGTQNSNTEGFVVKIEDREGLSPLINWGQLLGGGASSTNVVYALAVSDDEEIYAGGYTSLGTGWEDVTSYGTCSSNGEGFLVEIQDGLSPGLNWLQWLGGSNYDCVNALVLNGDEIYAGGDTSSLSGWESFTYVQGAGSSSEGFVAEIQDGATPVLNWFQWVGGDGNDYVTSLAVDGDEIYAAGYSFSGTGWEGATLTRGSFYGTADIEGFVVEIQDAETGPPANLNWKQWIGGTYSSRVDGLAVYQNEIYVIGQTQSKTGWESASYTQGTYSDLDSTEGFYQGFVVEIQDPPTASLTWRQWLGGGYGCTDKLTGVVVNGDYVYVAGQPYLDESIPFFGTYEGGQNGYIVKMQDQASAAPAYNWGQWIGGGNGSSAQITAVAVAGEEIYIGGYASSLSGLPITLQGAPVNYDGFVIEIQAGETPVFNWGQWLGGNGNDYVTALAVDGDEIYAGGYSQQRGDVWEPVTLTRGSFYCTECEEGFVVEIQDPPGPSLNWLQWLGGNGASHVTSLAVSGNDEVYAGGYSYSPTGWEGVSVSRGVHSGENEGFVVEILDPPGANLSWRQWLGGAGNDYVNALTVVGDEIYAGGNSSSEFAGESSLYTSGLYYGSSEGFVVEIQDPPTASLSWLQWLGGSAGDAVNALAANGDEIYAGGVAKALYGETVLYTQGSCTNVYDGFVAEIQDQAGAAPQINWLQWLGGNDDSNESVSFLAVNGDEIYAEGISRSASGWELANQCSGFHSGGKEGFVVEIKDTDTGPPSKLEWMQWLGGTGNDSVKGIAIDTNNIYIAGMFVGTGWEPIPFQGSDVGGFYIRGLDIDKESPSGFIGFHY